MSDSSPAIVDGCNVAYHGVEVRPTKIAFVKNLRLMAEKIASWGMKPIIVVSAALKYKVDSKEEFKKMVSNGLIFETPAGINDDNFILDITQELNGLLISNDRYKDAPESYSEVLSRRHPFMIVDDLISIPTLKILLQKP